MSAKHTPEKWWSNPNDHLIIEAQNGRLSICEVHDHSNTSADHDLAEAGANARRIVAAVNACAGIPTEALEAGVVGELLIEAKKIGTHARLDDLHPKDFQRLRIIVTKALEESP